MSPYKLIILAPVVAKATAFVVLFWCFVVVLGIAHWIIISYAVNNLLRFELVHSLSLSLASLFSHHLVNAPNSLEYLTKSLEYLTKSMPPKQKHKLVVCVVTNVWGCGHQNRTAYCHTCFCTVNVRFRWLAVNMNVFETDTGDHYRHHFICPIIQHYAHLHQYSWEEQDSKVRQEH